MKKNMMLIYAILAIIVVGLLILTQLNISGAPRSEVFVVKDEYDDGRSESRV